MGVLGELRFFPGHVVKNWDCPEKSGMDGHLTIGSYANEVCNVWPA